MLRFWLPSFFLFACVCAAQAQQPPNPANQEGVRPAGSDGRPLNLDFETGTLQDWVVEGDAFAGQPVKGDTVAARRGDMRSQHQGQYWVGGYERSGDKARGTLTSVPFRVTHPWASFLIGGGPWAETCVELIRKDTGVVLFRASGIEEENLRRVVVDLQPYQGKEVVLRLVDRHTGHWGHLNFDDFRFHEVRPKFPARPVHAKTAPADEYKFAGLPPEKAAAVMTVPEGFSVTLFAGEPDVHQPVALCLDDRGRVWVAEAYCYPKRKPHPGPLLPKGVAGDRILIFEDADGDGKFDRRTVFQDGLNLVSGLEVGFGGVWVGAAPYLLFIPDRDADDRPDGPPEVLLDGWGHEDTHETLNTFTWGPDGWLYGCHGVFTHSRVGKPGTPDERRVKINAGVWRYHPTRHEFEVFAHGTSNPWGLDFDDRGQAFVEACVIPHAFHIVQGGRYHRQAGSHFNPYTYADIQTIADHRHYVGATPHGGNNRSDSVGGGHAHCGTMIYLGGTWPAEYRNRFFMGNIHGRRLNTDVLKPAGSGYVAGHGPDFLRANDAWARFINLRYGPDGNVYLIDWYDKQACHTGDVKIWDRGNGRIYKVSYRAAKPVAVVDLRKLSDAELAKLQLHQHDWYVRHARRLLQERKVSDSQVIAALNRALRDEKDDARRLRVLWALHTYLDHERHEFLRPESLQAGRFNYLSEALNDPSPHVRAWGVQLAVESSTVAQIDRDLPLEQFVRLAKSDPSPVVRLYLASACQRLPLKDRWGIVEGLVSHAEDAGDHNLPLMYWYAAEPLAEVDAARALRLAEEAKVPQLLPFMVRRIASLGTPEALALVIDGLGKADGKGRVAYLQSINLALKGQRGVPMPKAWQDVYAGLATSATPEVRSQAQALAVTFGDPRAFAELRRTAADAKAPAASRQQALASLAGAGDRELPPLLLQLLNDPAVRADALRAMAGYDHPATPEAVLKVFPTLPAAEKRDALGTLAARASHAAALLDALATKRVAAADVPADVIRQLRSLKDKRLDDRIAEVWGVVRTTPAERKQLMAKYQGLIEGPGLPPDLSLGRALFAKTCQQCHVLFGVGGKVGPDITGANRADLKYLLENVIDPHAVIPKEYAVTLLELNSGRVINGIVKEQTPAAVTVVTATETLTLPRSDVEAMTPTDQSMMPDDQLKPLTNHEARSLFAYLQSQSQVPLLATPENAKDFFNGKDLTGWDGDPKLWRVENGEIVGRSPGLKHNNFLRSQFTASDFTLTLKVKLTPDAGNSGVQFRSEVLPGGAMKGLQADVGAGWWGKLYDEHGRGLLWDKSGEPYVRTGEWNDYKIEAIGTRVRTWINGQPCVDVEDTTGPRRGVFALQLHSGPAMEVRYKDLVLTVGGGR